MPTETKRTDSVFGPPAEVVDIGKFLGRKRHYRHTMTQTEAEERLAELLADPEGFWVTCPVCSADRAARVKLTRRGWPYISCAPCGLQAHMRQVGSQRWLMGHCLRMLVEGDGE